MKERITNSCLFKCFFVLLLAFTTKMPTNLYGSTIVINGQSYEDLGLPSGTLWSLRNVGANTSTEVGYFYAWGETLTTLDGKLYFRKDNYKWASVPGEGYWGPEYLTKYYSGDGKKTLDSNNDPAALGQYGSGGVMPTDIQMKELLTECTWTPTSGGVNVVGPNGSSIFLPAGGYKYDNNTYESGESLCYWSKDVHYYNSTYNWERACNFWVYSDASSIQRAQNICDYSDGLGGSNRFYGMLIRPVATTYASRVKVTSIIISGPSSIGADATEKLTASCSPSNASSKKVWWTTSDYTIADVDAEGNVTGKKVGTVTITAIAKDGGGAKKTKTISIVAPIEVTSIAISGSTSIAVGSSTTLTATCSPSNATNKSITWSSSNTKVATVTSQGVVTGNAVGTTTIKAQASNGVYKEVTMEVTAGTDFVDLGLPSGTLWGIRNIGAANSTACGNYYAWGETITTSSGKSSFRKDNYKWASVPGEGYWGPEYLTKYYSSDGKKTLDASDQPTSQYNSNSIMPSDIQMKELLTECTWTQTSGGVTIVGPNGSSIFLPAGGYKYDTQTYDSGTSLCYWSKDVNYYNSTYYWESACGLFIEMNASSIQGLQNSCRYNCGIGCLNRFYGQLIRPVSTYYASRVKITQITISGPSYVRVGETEQLTVTCSPYNVSSKKVWWTTSDNTIADVDADGKVTGKKIGSVTITAIAKDGSGVSATRSLAIKSNVDDRPSVVTSNTAGATVTFSNSNTYEWEWDSTNSRLRSTNYQIASSTSQTTITIVATKSTTLAFNYAVSSQSNYDKYTITLDGSTIVNAISGVSNSSYSGTVSAGTHTLVLSYSKNASTNSYQDRAYFSNLKLTHSHSYSNGICSGCGEYEAPTLSGSYYLIDNAGKLYWFAQKVNAGSTSISGKLTDNITVNSNVLTSAGELYGTPSKTWTPIGNASKPYAGTFEGQNYSISGLYTNTSSASFVGFFGGASGATIQNISIKDSYFCGYEQVAGICGFATNSRFAKCSNYSRIKGTNFSGGIVGDTDTKCYIDNCCNYGKISGSNSIGGILGEDEDDDTSEKRIHCCINHGVISGSSDVGGIIGRSYTYPIRDCANYANVTGSGSNIGGICGRTSEVSYSTTSYTYYEYSTIANCLNVSSVTGSTSGSIVGSLHSGTTITNCYFDSSKKSNAFGSGTATGATGRTSFSTGAVAYLLNGSKSATDECNWYQNIDNGSSDAYPVPDDTHGDVYALPQLDYYTNSVIVPATSVTVASQEIAVGQSLTMTATVLPTNATVNTQAFKNKYIEPIDWSGGTSGIATIDSETGDVTTVGNGTVTFTAKVLDGSNKTGSATVRAYLLGDANGNDKVNVADVTTIAAKLNGLTPANYHFAPANANFTDAVINSADITTTLGIAWNGVSYTAPARHAADRDNEPTRLYAIPLTAMAGNEAVLSIVVDNPSETFSAFDFVIELPEGLSVKKSADGTLIAQVSTERTDADKTDYFSATQREDGTVYVLCYSTMLDQFEGQAGTVATITLELDRNLECGDYEIALRDIVLSGYGEVISCDDNTSTVSVVTPDGIEGVNDEAAPGWVYDLNGRLVKIDGQPVRSLDNLPEGIYVINGQKVSK